MVVEDFVEVLEVLIVVKLRVAVESVAVFGLYCTFTLRLWPASSVVGREVDAAENAVFELLRSVTRTGESPEFVMEIFCEAALPTFTSPKSTELGLTRTALVVEENAFDSDPQPDAPMPRSTAPVRARSAIPARLRQWFLAPDGSHSLLVVFLASKKEKLRILFIRRHLSQSRSHAVARRCRKPR
jgi:hypothetical protein